MLNGTAFSNPAGLPALFAICGRNRGGQLEIIIVPLFHISFKFVYVIIVSSLMLVSGIWLFMLRLVWFSFYG
jgi:hypothetical protein